MKSTQNLTSYGWQASQLHQALSILAKKASLLSSWPETLSGYYGPADNSVIDQWMVATTEQIGLKTEMVEIAYGELERRIQQIGPALIHLPSETTPLFLAVLKGGKKGIKVITPNYKVRYLDLIELRDVLVSDLEAPIAQTIATLLTEVNVPEKRQAATKKAILREQLGSVPIGGCWLLRLSPGDDFLKQIRSARLPRQLLIILGASLIGQLLMLLGWWLLGRGALEGHFEWAWLSAWALLLFTAIPVQLLSVWMENRLSLGLNF